MISNDNDILILTVREITEQKSNQQELLQAKEMAEKSCGEKSDLITRMSNELRTPMNAILSFSRLLEDDANETLSEVQNTRLNQIHQEGTQLLNLINDALDSAKIELGKIDLQKENSAPEVHHQATYTLLYVENNLTNLNLVQQIVNKKKNIHLLSTTHARQAIKLAHSAKPDLIIMDINMPEMDGNHLFNELKNFPETKYIPVIAISASEMREEINQALQAGFRDYLTKPLKISSFMDVLDNYLIAKASQPTT
jgi:CheY-like chemotaxis protein